MFATMEIVSTFRSGESGFLMRARRPHYWYNCGCAVGGGLRKALTLKILTLRAQHESSRQVEQSGTLFIWTGARLCDNPTLVLTVEYKPSVIVSLCIRHLN